MGLIPNLKSLEEKVPAVWLHPTWAGIYTLLAIGGQTMSSPGSLSHMELVRRLLVSPFLFHSVATSKKPLSSLPVSLFHYCRLNFPFSQENKSPGLAPSLVNRFPSWNLILLFCLLSFYLFYSNFLIMPSDTGFSVMALIVSFRINIGLFLKSIIVQVAQSK